MAAEAKVDPMHQFTIEPLGGTAGWEIAGYNIAFTNSALWMLITTVVLTLFVAGGLKRQMVPGRWQMAVETFTGFIDNMLEANIGKAGRKYVPYVFSLFMFILFANLLGLLPLGVVGLHPFTFTSHFTVTGVLAVLSFAIVLVVGFWRHGLHFFSLFWPKDANIFLGAFVFVIEVLSFLSRPFTLAIRLFANMTAGHVLLKVFGTFVVALGSFNAVPYVFGILPLAVNVALTGLEVLIAVVQAYVFALLASLYLNDAVNLH